MSKRKTSPPPTLPDHLIEYILIRLPLPDLCRCAVLAKRFRYSWRRCRHLTFDHTVSRRNFAAAVTYFLRKHADNGADTFHLCYAAATADDSRLVGKWIGRGVKLGISQLELDFAPSETKFRLKSDLISVESIRVMKLVNCELSLPFRTAAFRHLQTLILKSMRARPVTVNVIFQNCYDLAALELIDCTFLYCLKISAENLKSFRRLIIKDCADVCSISLNCPALQKFHYNDRICDVTFNTPVPYLTDLLLDFAPSRSFQGIPNMKEIVSALNFVKTLAITSVFLEGLNNISFYLKRLRDIRITIAPESYVNPADVAMFLKQCPNIEFVCIELGRNAFNNSGSYHWKSIGIRQMHEFNMTFPFLHTATIKGFVLREEAVMMGRFFLQHALCLRNLVIVKGKNAIAGSEYDPLIQQCLGAFLYRSARIDVHEFHQPA